MTKKAILILFITSFALASCVQKGMNELMPLDDQSQAHIFFNSANYSLKKTKTEVSQSKEGWAERAAWRSEQGKPFVSVDIAAHVTYDKVFMRSHVPPIEKRVQKVTGNASVSLGSHGKVITENGFYEYQAFSLNGIQCSYIQSYWGDQSLGGIDFVRGAEESDTIVGNHMLQASFCDQQKKEIAAQEVKEFLLGIDLTGAYWPINRFEEIN